MKERFEDIYNTNEWSYGSGEGSLPKNNIVYMKHLMKFLREKNIRSVVDLGCGDWQFSQSIDWQGANYNGYDIAEPVIKNNTYRFETDNIKFHTYSGDFNELPDADLIIAKDLLQHWSNETIMELLPQLKRYKYALITNCVKRSGKTVNHNTKDGGFRHLDLRHEPFNLDASEFLKFTNYRPFRLPWPFSRLPWIRRRWVKRVLLIDNS